MIAWVAVAIWAYLLIGRGSFWKRFPALPGHGGAETGTVIAVIPARNEVAHIGAAVRSLAPQVKRVIVVDDQSSDATADVARAAGAIVVKGRPLPAGWTGKMWAVAQGVDAAAAGNPEYLLLTDADIVHGSKNVSGLLARAHDGPLDLVSVMVSLRTATVAERALIPAFVFFFLMLYPPAWIADPNRRTAGAAGGCILIRREMLERIGGIETIAGELIDDCALAWAIKRNGGKVWLGLSTDTHSVREYRGFSDIWRMISRTAFTQLQYSLMLLAGTLLGLTLTFLAAPALALSFHFAAALPGALAWLMMIVAYLPMLRLYRRSPLWAPALPLIALFYMAATADSAAKYWSGRGGAWKGRVQARKPRARKTAQ